MQEATHTRKLYYIIFFSFIPFFSSCVGTEIKYKFNQRDLNEKTFLYHKQKIKDFEQCGKVTNVYWVHIPQYKAPLPLDFDSIITVNVDTVCFDQYKTIVYALDQTDIRGNAVELYELLNKEKYGVYLYRIPNAHNPFTYQVMYVFPSKLILVKTVSDKTNGYLSCQVLFENFEGLIQDMRRNKMDILEDDINEIKKILNTVALINVENWNMFKFKKVEVQDCLKEN